MLLFLLSHHFRELPEPPPTPRLVLKFRRDARALLGAGAFLCVWCLLRLLARTGEGLGVDVALAVACLCLGIRAVWHAVQTLRS